MTAPTAVEYHPPAEAQRMSTRQRKAVNELIRAFVPGEASVISSDVDFSGLLAARERLNLALAVAGNREATDPLIEAAREAVARIDEVTDALFAAAEIPADAQSWPKCPTFGNTGDPAHVVG